jgi:hypothetical protein
MTSIPSVIISKASEYIIEGRLISDMRGTDEAGEQAVSMSMPGGDCPVADNDGHTDTPSTLDLLEPLIRLIRVRLVSTRIPRCFPYNADAEFLSLSFVMFQHLSQTIMLLSRQTAHREFAERFTHAIILSPLLAETSSTNNTTSPAPPLALPQHEHEHEPFTPIHAWPLAAALLVGAAFIASGLIPACLIALVTGIAHATNLAPEHHARRFLALACGKLRSTGWLGDWEDDPAPVTLAALDRCVQAASVWDGVVAEAMTLLESEERK